jgi:site-specific DNA-adenine methylase
MFEIKFDDQNKINEELSKSNNQLTKSNEELTNHYRLLETELADQKLLFEQLRKEFNTLFQALTS